MPSYQKVKRSVQNYLGVDESEPHSVSAVDWLRSGAPAVGPAAKSYVKSLFPFIQWAPRYNVTWLVSDLIAGFTVGLVLVPQSLSYAKIALLDSQYGLYSSFIGVLTYAFFATSKDVSIGPVAVMSLETGNIITAVQAKMGDLYSAPEIATCLAFICGFIVLGIGLLRIGFLVEFIPQPAVSGFMTGSALNIAWGQVPALFGLSNLFNTRASTYLVVIDTLKYLPKAKLDTAFGVPALLMLYLMKFTASYLGKRYPRFERPAFFFGALRHATVIILFTIISWRLNIHETKARILLVGAVPSGLRDVGPPTVTTELLAALGPHIPVATIILLLEHISIAKSFGRLNGYKINPNQELVAIGVNNTLGSLFSAYPSTGSFSRSALKSKAGVRTPAAGIPTGIVVLVALYAVAPAFYWIPSATISALVIHAVADLVASPRQSFGFWRVAPFEYVIFVGAVCWSVFYTIESGIYWSLVTSAVLLLYRIARPKGHFLGRVKIRPEAADSGSGIRDVYVPLHSEEDGVTNRDIDVEAPPPGIVIYRFEESFLYPNASYINDRLVEHVKQTTRRGKDWSNISAGARPWNDPGPRKKDAKALLEKDEAKPYLRAVILDFSAVANLDTTGAQNLVDTRNEVEKWADRPVEFHFCGILSPWIRRALIAAGFGQGQPRLGTGLEVAPVVPNADALSPADRERQEEERYQVPQNRRASGSGSTSEASSFTNEKDVERQGDGVPVRRSRHASRTSLPLLDRATPFFHFDLQDAINSIDMSKER